jgi:hypothetical protein
MNRLPLALFLVVSISISQGTLAQVRLGVKAGVNASNIHFNLSTTDPIPGYQAGLMADIGLSSHFSIHPAVLVNAKGFITDLDFRDQNGQLQERARGTFRLVYAEVPVLLIYKGELGKKWHWYGGVGPYAGIGITGKSKWNSNIIANKKEKITFRKQSTTGYIYKRMDYGLNAAAGVEKGRVQLGINYSYGLTGIIPQENITVKTYNRTLAMTAGYWFGK